MSDDNKEDINFVISNLEVLKTQGFLEEKLMPAYLHAENFKDIKFEDLKSVFDACDKQKLQALPETCLLPQRTPSQNNNPFTVFRGCVGDNFRKGMSWTTCLYQAIKYPKRARKFNWYGNDASQPCSVWVAMVEKEDIYCCLDHYEPEFIVCPKEYWKIDIPQALFEYNSFDPIIGDRKRLVT